VLAGADDNELAPLSEFGRHAGLAFQLHDDFIGMFGDEKVSGKSAMDDLREGKMTLLMRHALPQANTEQLRTLETALGNKDVTREQHEAVKQLLEELGSREYVKQEAYVAAEAARKVLQSKRDMWSIKASEFLEELLDYIVSRDH
jgi:geranylgeranyl pyrophosphate synthase